MPPPETDLKRIERWCADGWPPRFRDEVRYETHRRGQNVTICETRVPWTGEGEWTHFRVAQLRYRPGTADWSLHWADRNDRWHVYDVHGPAFVGTAADLLAEIDDDPTCIFKG